MSVDYPIFTLRSDDPVLTEQLGSKPKFWFRFKEDTKVDWLFKYARPGTGEHWSEKVAYEVARLIDLPAARIELAQFEGKRGTASLNFVRRHEGEDLVHGDELLAGHVTGYDRDKVFRHSDHSVSNIVKAVEAVFPGAEERHTELTQLAGYLVLDALIGNTDRHHQNWGVLRNRSETGVTHHRIAPTFDHASSLGRNESEASLERKLRDGTVLNYARKGRGGIFWLSGDKRGANPLDLVEMAAKQWPDYFRPWLQRCTPLDESTFSSIVKAVPADWMTTNQRLFCVRFLVSTGAELKNIPS